MQNEEIKKLQQNIQHNEQQYKERLKQYKEKSTLFSRDMKSLKIRYDWLIEDNKRKTEEMKRMNDEIMAIYRQNEKDKVGEVRKEDERAKFAAKLKEEAGDFK